MISQRSGVVLLLGAPGVGKSLAGRLLKHAHSASVHAFVNVGQLLRATGMVEQHLRNPTSASKAALGAAAREILSGACCEFKAACAANNKSPLPQVLLLEFVKELDDAYTLMEVLAQHDLPLQQVLYIPEQAGSTHDSTSTTQLLLQCLAILQAKSASSMYDKYRDAAAMTEQRQSKWQRNMAALLEFFSSLGVLAEVAAWEGPPAAAAGAATAPSGSSTASSAAAGAAAGGSEAEAAPAAALQPPKGTLAALGYAAAVSGDCSGCWLSQVGWCSSANGSLHALNAWLKPERRSSYTSSSNMSTKSFLAARLIEPLTSRRLVTSAAERQQVMDLAAAYTGLCISSSRTNTGNPSSTTSSSVSFPGGFQLPVPEQSVSTLSDARWLAVPGRYMVSHKCDGTRCLLVATADDNQHCYLIDRAGMMYKHPYQSLCQESVASSVQHSDQADRAADCSPAAPAPLSSSHHLPAGTVLDGELVWLQATNLRSDGSSSSSEGRVGHFLVFDVLRIGSKQTWHLPLKERLDALQSHLQLPDADAVLKPQVAARESQGTIGAAAGSAAAATEGSSSSSSSNNNSSTAWPQAGVRISVSETQTTTPRGRAVSKYEVKVDLALIKKQQAPLTTDDSIALLFKPHYNVSAASLQRLQSQQESGSLPYPTDGLVFTPCAMPYALGMRQLLMKWQPHKQTGADLMGKQLHEDMRNSGYGLNRRCEQATGLPSDAASKAMTAMHSQLQMLPAGLVFECVMLTEAHVSRTGSAASSNSTTAAHTSSSRAQLPEKVVWLPQSVRWDKACGNDPSVLNTLQERLRRPAVACLSYEQLLQAARQVQEFVQEPPTVPEASTHSSSSTASSGSNRQHPARSMPFDELYAAVRAAVAAGEAECTTDEASGLEVFCYNMSEPPRSTIAALCRGLVLHPDSKTVVATPFVRFDDLKPEQIAQPSSASVSQASSSSTTSPGAGRGFGSAKYSRRGGRARSWAYPPPLTAAERQELELAKQLSEADFNNLQLYNSWAPSATASFKLDGSLIIAFMWRGQLYTCTRRRMTSEQAVWARDWLHRNAHLDALQPGWTYMFEALYSNNRHVVPYPFDALVLLGAIGPDGCELPSSAARQQLARQLGVMAAPCIEGSTAELTTRLAQGCHLKAQSSTDTTTTTSSSSSSKRGSVASAAPGVSAFETLGLIGPGSASSSANSSGMKPAAFEGWVLQEHATGQRTKLVLESFLQTGHAASQLLHPLAVWDAVYVGKSRATLMQGLPAHYQAELDAVLTALEQQFWAVHRQLSSDLQRSWMLGAAAGSAEGAASAAVGSASCSVAAAVQVATDGESKGAISAVSSAPAGAEEDGESDPNNNNSSSPSSSSGGSGGTQAVAAPATTSELVGAAAVLHPQAYSEALQYAQRKSTAFVRSMFMNTLSSGHDRDNYQPAPSLRGLLLSCIKPSTDGTLAGYTPSPAFKQTYCKGWAQGPTTGRASVLAGEPLINTILDDQALLTVLGLLLPGAVEERRAAGRVLLVCRAWSKLLQGDAGFQAKAQEFASTARSRRGRSYETDSDSPAEYYSSSGRRGYSWFGNADDSDYGGGYGSM